MNDFIEAVGFFSGVLLAIVVMFAVILTPIMYLEGTAKSEYMERERGVKMAWYKAAFLPDTVFVDAKITTKQEHGQ